MKIGIIREGKTPPDSRVLLTPDQCKFITENFNIEIIVQPFAGRCFPDKMYQQAGIELSDDLSDCDVLMGVKEVPIKLLMPDKTYFFFSHIIKKQAYNRNLLWAILDKNIRMVDYEVLTDEQGRRLIAFGKFAGMVGAHNALWTYGKRTGKIELPRMNSFLDYAEVKQFYSKMELPIFKVALTGTGRVANGAAMVLDDMGIQKVAPNAFLNNEFNVPVYTQLDCQDYATRKDGSPFELTDFFKNPHLYKSIFEPYAQSADIMINGIYWDNNAPAFFSRADMASSSFKVRVIADVTCDIAPVSSIPSTLRASTIADPVFGFDLKSGEEIAAFSEHGIDMMTIDNLPNELPRDASTAFGQQFIDHILPEIIQENSALIERATVTECGVLGKHFRYLEDYVNGEQVSKIG